MSFPASASLDDTTTYSYSWKISLIWPATRDAIYYLAVFAPSQTTFNNSCSDDEESSVMIVPPVFDISINYTLPPSPDNIDNNNSSQQPINDLCTSATEVTSFPYFEYGTLRNATRDELLSKCAGSSWYGTDVWYKISNVPDGARIDVGTSGFGSTQVTAVPFISSNASCSSTNDYDEESSLAPYCTCPKGMIEMSASEASIDGLSSWGYAVYWNATKGATYYVTLFTDVEELVMPRFDLSISITPPIPFDKSIIGSHDPPSNDLCESSMEVSNFPFNESGTLANATNDALSRCQVGTRGEGNDVWYKIRDVPEGSEIRINIYGIKGEVLEAFGSCPPNELQCVEPDDIYAMSSIDDNYVWEHFVYWQATGGSIYYLAVFVNDFSGGSFIISITYSYPPPINDYCDNPKYISVFPFIYSGLLVNTTNDAYSTCAGGYKIQDVPNGKIVQVDVSGNGTTIVQVKPLVSSDLGYCPYRLLCIEPAFISSMQSINEYTGSWEYSIALSTSEGLIYYIALYTDEEEDGPNFELSVKLLVPYDSTNLLSSSSSTLTDLTKSSLASSTMKTTCCMMLLYMGMSGILFFLT